MSFTIKFKIGQQVIFDEALQNGIRCEGGTIIRKTPFSLVVDRFDGKGELGVFPTRIVEVRTP